MRKRGATWKNVQVVLPRISQCTFGPALPWRRKSSAGSDSGSRRHSVRAWARTRPLSFLVAIRRHSVRGVCVVTRPPPYAATHCLSLIISLVSPGKHNSPLCFRAARGAQMHIGKCGAGCLAHFLQALQYPHPLLLQSKIWCRHVGCHRLPSGCQGLAQMGEHQTEALKAPHAHGARAARGVCVPNSTTSPAMHGAFSQWDP